MLYFKVLRALSSMPLFGSIFRAITPLFGDIIYLELVYREEVKSDFASHTEDIFLLELRAKDPAIVFSFKWYFVTTAPTTADFGAMALGDFLLHKGTTPVLYMKDVAAAGDDFAAFDVTT